MADTMIHMKDDSLCSFMTKEDIRVKAPYVFATGATNPAVSGRYVFASTEAIIDDMAKLGWNVVDCKQQRANKNSTVKSFHIVAFQNPNIFITKENKDGEDVECFPRVILANSHDGFNSFKFMVGFFRLVCGNGTILATETFENVSIRHINYTFDELREMVAKALTTISGSITVMSEMRNTVLTEEQKKEIALEALKIRSGNDEKIKVTDEDLEDILTPIRKEDEGNDLWTVFNVLQEKIIKGNFKMISPTNKKVRKARPITGAAKDIEVNQALFKKIISYRNVV